MVREFEERAEEMGRRSMVKDAFRFAKELGIELNLEHPRTVKTELRKCQTERLEEEVGNQRWQGSLVTTRLQDEKLSASGCFWWLTEWKSGQHTQSPACLNCTNNYYQLDYMHVRRPIQVWRARRGAGCVVRPPKVWLTSCLGAVRWHRVSTFPDTTVVG